MPIEKCLTYIHNPSVQDWVLAELRNLKALFESWQDFEVAQIPTRGRIRDAESFLNWVAVYGKNPTVAVKGSGEIDGIALTEGSPTMVYFFPFKQSLTQKDIKAADMIGSVLGEDVSSLRLPPLQRGLTFIPSYGNISREEQMLEVLQDLLDFSRSAIGYDVSALSGKRFSDAKQFLEYASIDSEQSHPVVYLKGNGEFNGVNLHPKMSVPVYFFELRHAVRDWDNYAGRVMENCIYYHAGKVKAHPCEQIADCNSPESCGRFTPGRRTKGIDGKPTRPLIELVHKVANR